MAKKVTTVFIRDTAVNLLVMKGMLVEKWASLPLEPGLVSQGLIQDEAEVASRVKELFKLEKVTTTKVIAGLSGLDSLYRMIILPEVPEAILAEAVKHEARRIIPVSLDQVYLSYQPIPDPRGETRIFLAAFPRNVADALLRTLREAGLEPYLMDLAPLALCRIPNEPRAIIVNTRLEHLDIMVIADRLPQLIRRLSLPGEAQSLSEKLPAITEEFSRTVAFYNSSHLERPLDSTVPVFICGELAEAPETWQSLVGNLDYSVSLLPSPVESPEGFPVNEFMVNIGLALKELLPEKAEANFSIVNLNTQPEVYLPKAVRLPNILVPIGMVVGIGLLAYMGFLIYNEITYTGELRSELASIEDRVLLQRQAILAVNGEIEQMELQIEPVEAATNTFNTTLTSLGEGREQVDGDLSEIVSLLPTSVNRYTVNHGGDSVTVSGMTSSDEDDIFKYARDLRNSGRFPIVLISSITAEEEEGEIEGFNFEFLLK